MKTRSLILGFLGIFTITWVIDALLLNTMAGDTAWIIRNQAMYLTGVWSMAAMAASMLLATRPVWLENIIGGMDKIYHLHKWLGITAITTGLVHWLIKLSSGQIAEIIGKTGKPGREAVLDFMTSSRGLSKDLGEWSLYIMLVLLALALYKKFPYKPWRLLHKIMPLLFLALVFHALALTPLNYWYGPTGVLLAIALSAGTIAAIYIMAQQIGRKHKYNAKIISLQPISDGVLELNCEVAPNWPGHKAGQFAFVRFNSHECAHPFSIASAPQGKLLRFEIKALGDFTNTLAKQVNIGQDIEIEGPYGRFNYKSDNQIPQVWVAAGIGITPFIAWLEDLQLRQDHIPIDMHYCVKQAENDALVVKIKELCCTLPRVNLYIHDQTKRLNAETIITKLMKNINELDLWFCGPQKFARQLAHDFNSMSDLKVHFHKEEFNMR